MRLNAAKLNRRGKAGLYGKHPSEQLSGGNMSKGAQVFYYGESDGGKKSWQIRFRQV